MPKIQTQIPPLIRREGNRAIVELSLDGTVDPAWREIFDQLAREVELPGIAIEVSNDVPDVQGSVAAMLSVDLSQPAGKGLDGQLTNALELLSGIVGQANAESHRRDNALARIGRVAQAWWDALPNE